MMKANVSELTKIDGASIEVKFNERIAELESEINDFSFNESVDFRGTLYNSAGSLNLEGMASTKYSTFCSKCLLEIERQISVNLQENFVENTAETDEEEYYYEGSNIVFDKAVADNIILQLPMKPVCFENCKGVCPTCGVNLNKEDCKCKKEAITEDLGINPKMGALNELMKKIKIDQ